MKGPGCNDGVSQVNQERRHGMVLGHFAKKLRERNRNRSIVRYVRLQNVLIRRGQQGFHFSRHGDKNHSIDPISVDALLRCISLSAVCISGHRGVMLCIYSCYLSTPSSGQRWMVHVQKIAVPFIWLATPPKQVFCISINEVGNKQRSAHRGHLRGRW